MNPQLVLEGKDLVVVAFAGFAAVVEDELGDNEHRDPPGAGCGIGEPCQHEMDDVLGQVLITPGDEDLGAEQPVGAIVLGNCLGAKRTEVGAGVGLGEIHGAGPFTTNQLLHVGVPSSSSEPWNRSASTAPWVSVGHKRKRHVRRLEQLFDDNPDQVGEAAPTPLFRKVGSGPSRVDELPVRLFETVGSAHGPVLGQHRTLAVADLIEGGHDLGEEPTRFFEEGGDSHRIGVLITVELRYLIEPSHMIQDEVDVVEPRGVCRHVAKAKRAPKLRQGRGHI